MATVTIDGHDFEGVHLRTARANIMLIKATDGFLGCAYFDIATSNRLKEPVAIVTGVRSFDDMLQADVIRMSDAARDAGVREGMSGREALLILECAAVK